MIIPHKPSTILLADDDREDCRLVADALQETRRSAELRWVHDGEALLAYLLQRGSYSAPGAAPGPDLILLDLHMAGMDGLETLARIKGNPDLRRTPIVMLTTSRREEDIRHSYDFGASSFVSKPPTFSGLVALMDALVEYWFGLVQLPMEH